MAIVQMFLRLHYPITLWIILLLLSTFLLSPVLPEIIYRVDPLALLSATLRTYQRAGCDSEQISLSCPRGTSISIELAQYGHAGDLTDSTLCPSHSDDDTTTSLSDSVVHSGTEIEVKPPESCSWPNALQYSLLQTVVEACQKKRHCKFTSSPKSIAGDPCPGIRKFVEIAYKCRPYEFRSKVACENDVMQLICNPYSRIAIYSASFGRQEYEGIQCSQPQGVKEESCLASYATETVMQICHGRRRCSLTADSSTFGNPCKPDTRMYLKVVYTCIPRKVLKDRYETTPEQDEPLQTEFDMDQDDLYDEDQFYKESEAIPPAPKLQGGLTNPSKSMEYPYSNIDATSSIIPPIFSRNDNSLEVTEYSTENITSLITSTTDESLTSTIINFPSTQVTTISHSSENPNIFPTLMSATTASNLDDFLFSKSDNDDIFGTEYFNTLKSSKADIIRKYFNLKPQKKFDLNQARNRIRNEKHLNLISEQDHCDEGNEKVYVIGFITEWMQAIGFLIQNQEKFYLYLIISVTAGVLLCLTLVIGRFIIQKRKSNTKNNSDTSKTFHQSSTGETQLPNGFSDDISEIDADIDLTTPLPVPSVSSRNQEQNYMTYAAASSNPYGSLAQSNMSHASNTMLVPTSGLIMSAGSGGGGVGGNPGTSNAGSIGSRQTPPPSMISSSSAIMGPPVSGTMGPLMPISSVSHHTTTPSYISGTLMVGHHGTLRRPLMPPTSGIMATSSPPPSTIGITTGNICYDTTLPRNPNRMGGISIADPTTGYYYG